MNTGKFEKIGVSKKACKTISDRFSSLLELSRERRSLPGLDIGQQDIDRILSVLCIGEELAKQRVCSWVRIGEKIERSERVAAFMREKIGSKKQEHVMVILLDAKLKVIDFSLVHIGTATASYFSPRDIFRSAIEKNAFSLIVAHNHPSGCLIPSEKDIILTEGLVKAGRLLGVEVLDHVIVDTCGFNSMRENNKEIFS